MRFLLAFSVRDGAAANCFLYFSRAIALQPERDGTGKSN
jgi:hypothetical protein